MITKPSEESSIRDYFDDSAEKDQTREINYIPAVSVVITNVGTDMVIELTGTIEQIQEQGMIDMSVIVSQISEQI